MKRVLISALVLFSLLSASPLVLADQILLKNGDRLTGKITKKDGGKVTIETEAAGTVTVNWDAVEKITIDEPVFVELADGKTVKGTVTGIDEGVEVKQEAGDALKVENSGIAAIRTPAGQEAYEKELRLKNDPGLFQLWTGSADVGFSLTTGNSKTRALTFGTKASRATVDDKISLYAKGIQASNSNSGTSVTTAEAFWFGGRYDRNLNNKTFVFGTADFEYDKPQQLNMRTVLGGGFGYRWIRTERTELDLFGGGAFNREYYANASNRSSAEVLFGNDLNIKLTDRTQVEQRLVVYPSVSRAGTFRSRLDATVVTSLNDWLGWQVSLGNRYNSDPVPGAVSNDFLFSTGLRATFGKKK